MIISKSLTLVAVVVIGIAIAMTACTLVRQAPTATPTPTPTPIAVRDCYMLIENVATRRPAQLERALKNEAYLRCIGPITNTEIGTIQFHVAKTSGFDKYINCEMRRETVAEEVSIGQTIAVRGRLKDAFNEDKRLGSLMGTRNENVIELKDCVILAY
ncbi:MAG: hypothetical protein F4X64_00260 [Chloroflexi bacterium]|nr:hypothetical protein [Chloroflexota bacterium]